MPASPHSFFAKSPVPVYALCISQDDVLIYAGGGGQSNSGISNAIRSARIAMAKRSLSDGAEIKLSTNEDAPMCLAVAGDDEGGETEENESDDGSAEPAGRAAGGIRSSRRLVVGVNSPVQPSGDNENLRAFTWSSSRIGARSRGDAERQDKRDPTSGSSSEKANGEASAVQGGNETEIHGLKATKRAASIRIRDPDTYIKCSVISPNGRFLAIGGTDGQVSLHAFPSLEKLWGLPSSQGNSINDACFSADSALVAFVTPSAIQIYPTAKANGGMNSNTNSVQGGSGSGAPDVYQTIRNPTLKGTSGCVFRSARFGRSSKSQNDGGLFGASNRLFTVVNTSPPAGLGSSKSDRAKAKIRKCFVSSWDTDSWTLLKTRQISERPATVLEVSENGKHLAVSTSDLSLHLLSASSLSTIWQLKDTHAFPSTCLAFSPKGNILASGSADMSLRLVQVGEQLEPPVVASIVESKAATALFALLLAYLAWYIQQRFVPDTTNVSKGGMAGGTGVEEAVLRSATAAVSAASATVAGSLT